MYIGNSYINIICKIGRNKVWIVLKKEEMNNGKIFRKKYMGKVIDVLGFEKLVDFNR